MVAALPDEILPVFAGMIPVVYAGSAAGFDSPHIRGDDPESDLDGLEYELFSPYSRG